MNPAEAPGPDAHHALVFADARSHYYVVPLEVIAENRVSDDLREDIDEDLGVDAMGFASLGHGYSLVGPLTLSHEQAHALHLLEP